MTSPLRDGIGLLERLWTSATQRVISLKFGGMLLALLMDVLIAARLGTSGTADALIIALTLPLFVDTVIRESSNFSLVPIFVEERHSAGRSEYLRFVSGLLNASLVGGAVLAAGVAVAAPWIVGVLGPGLPEPAARGSVDMLRAAAPMVALAPAITLQGVLLDSERRFSLVAMRNGTVPGTVVLVIALTWSSPDTAFWIASAYSLGFGVFFTILFLGARATGFDHRWSAWPDGGDLSRVAQAVQWPVAGFVVRQASRMVERMLASLVAVGGVSAYYFSFRLFSASQALIGSSVAITGLPDLSVRDAEGDRTAMASRLRARLKLTLALVIPATVVVLLFHREIVELIYARGAFDAGSVARTSDLLFWFGWGILFLSIVPVLQSALYARQAYRTVFRNMLAMALFNVAVAWGLSRWLGLAGIAISVSLTAAVSVANLAFLVPGAGVPVWSAAREGDRGGS